jgi:hypothetical protein
LLIYFSSVIYRQIGTLKNYGTQNFDRKGIIAKLSRMRERFTGNFFVASGVIWNRFVCLIATVRTVMIVLPSFL